MKLKLVTWNMGFRTHQTYLEAAWKYLFEEIDADIILVQESQRTQELKNDPHLLWFEIGDTRKWGTGIYSKKYPIQELPIEGKHICDYTGSLVVGEVGITDKVQLTIISLYGLFDYLGKTPYSITTLHRMLSDLTGILNGHQGAKRNIIFGGDLNASIQWDDKYGGDAHKIFFLRLEDFKLKNCFKPFFADYVQTHRHFRSNEPWQDDYFFISTSLSKNLKSCTVIDNENVRRLSDHNPVLIELEL